MQFESTEKGRDQPETRDSVRLANAPFMHNNKRAHQYTPTHLPRSHTPKPTECNEPPAVAQLTNETIQGQRLSENEDENHAHKQLGLLSICPAHHRQRARRSSRMTY